MEKQRHVDTGPNEDFHNHHSRRPREGVRWHRIRLICTWWTQRRARADLEQYLTLGGRVRFGPEYQFHTGKSSFTPTRT